MKNRPYAEVKADFLFGMTIFITFMIIVSMALA